MQTSWLPGGDELALARLQLWAPQGGSRGAVRALLHVCNPGAAIAVLGTLFPKTFSQRRYVGLRLSHKLCTF